MKVLLVDDDKIIRMGMRKIIEKSGQDFSIAGEAGNGEEALTLLETMSDIDIVITDMQMPIMDGLELISEIKKRHIIVKVIVLSGYDDFKYVHQSFREGSVDYLLKPVNREELRHLLEETKKLILSEISAGIYRKRNEEVFMAQKLYEMHHDRFTDEDREQLRSRGLSLDRPYFVCILQPRLFGKQQMNRSLVETLVNQKKANILAYTDTVEQCRTYVYVDDLHIVFCIIGKDRLDVSYMQKTFCNALSKPTDEDIQFVFGISNLYEEEHQMKQAYAEAVSAAKDGFYQEEQYCILPEQIGSYVDVSVNLEAVSKELSHYIELGDYVNGKRIVEELFQRMKQTDPDTIRACMKALLDRLFIYVKEFQVVIHSKEKEYEMYLHYIGTCTELKSYMLHILHIAIDYIQSERKKGSQARIDIAKKYMKQHYMESITLNDLADYVELNPSYFSNLFKVETGVNFSDYLLEIRMDMAKRLLRDPKHKIYEVGNLVGYEDVVSFGRAFKKKIGMSPKEYRNSVYLSEDVES